MKVLSKGRALFILLPFVLCISILALFLLLRQGSPKAASITMLSPPYALAKQKVSLLDQMMPRGSSWAWLWKLRYAWSGKGSAIKIRGTIVDFGGADMTRVANLGKADFATTNGVEVW